MPRAFVLFLGATFLCGCQDLTSRLKVASTGDAPRAVEKIDPIGRFQLQQSVAHVPPGKDVHVTLRLDTRTGETWVLAVDGYRWIGVEDDLHNVGTYNPKTSKIEWGGVSTPDGRNLNELSREELIRYLSAAIRNGQRTNPEDPLGLFEVHKRKP